MSWDNDAVDLIKGVENMGFPHVPFFSDLGNMTSPVSTVPGLGATSSVISTPLTYQKTKFHVIGEAKKRFIECIYVTESTEEETTTSKTQILLEMFFYSFISSLVIYTKQLQPPVSRTFMFSNF